MASHIFATVRYCPKCAINRPKLRIATNPLELLLHAKMLTNLCLDIIKLFTESKSGYKFLLVITDRFKK